MKVTENDRSCEQLVERTATKIEVNISFQMMLEILFWILRDSGLSNDFLQKVYLKVLLALEQRRREIGTE